MNHVRDTLDGMAPWDGQNRIGLLMAAFLGAADDSYTREVEHLLIGAAIARTFEPGCKFDHMPVLIGNQGLGKSTFMRKLSLDPVLYTDSVVGIGTKQAAELVQGKWFVELPELAAMKGAALEAVKAFITRQADEYRMPYERHVESRPRRFVMVGTTNAREFLSDLTGNRRFLPIRCGDYTPEMSLFSSEASYCFAQAWAEAYKGYREGSLGRSWQLTLSPEASVQATDLQAESGIDNPRIGIIEEWMSGQEDGSVICTVQAMEEVLDIPREMQRRCNQMEGSDLLQNSIEYLKTLDGKRKLGNYRVQRAFAINHKR